MSGDRYEVLTTLPPGAGDRTRVALQWGDFGFSRAVVLRELAQGAQTFTSPPVDGCILPLLDVIDHDGRRWAVFEFVPGATLFEVCDAHFQVDRLPSLGLIARVVIDAAKALDGLSKVKDPLGFGVPARHGGISDASLMLGFDGRSRVLDFGARRLSRFMAPELTRGEQFDERSDVFSLAATLHSALTRFDKGYAATVQGAPSPEEFPPPSVVHPEATSELDAVVMHALLPTPKSRFKGPGELAEELEKAIGPQLFATEQVELVLQPLFGDRLAALKELLDPSRRKAKPGARPSQPKTELPWSEEASRSERSPGARPAASAPKAAVAVPSDDFGEDAPTSIHSAPAAGFDATVPGRGMTPGELAAASAPLPSLADELEQPTTVKPRLSGPQAVVRAPGSQLDDDRARAKGQEKISTADLDPDEQSDELKSLQNVPLLGSELEAPTAVKPRVSSAAIPAVVAQVKEPGSAGASGWGELDPAMAEGESRPAEQPAGSSQPAAEPLEPRPAGPRVALIAVVLIAVLGIGSALAFQRLKVRQPLPEPAVVEVIDEPDAGALAPDPDGGAPEPAAVAPAVGAEDAGSSDRGLLQGGALDAGVEVDDDEEDDGDAGTLASDAGRKDAGIAKPTKRPVKKKKRRR